MSLNRTSPQRVVVSVAAEVADGSGSVGDVLLDEVVSAITARAVRGDDVALVVGNDAVAAVEPLGTRYRPGNPARCQAVQSIGQGLLIYHYCRMLRERGLQIGFLQVPSSDVARAEYQHARDVLHSLLHMGVIPVIGDNCAAPHRGHRTDDALAVMVAHLIRADLLVLIHGSGECPDSAAAAASAGTHVIVTEAETAELAVEGAEVGLHVQPAGRRPPTRLLWLTHAADSRGSIIVDDGAADAVALRRRSLLPVGVMQAEGRFSAGDAVDIRTLADEIVGRGIVNYDADTVPRLLGRTTQWLGQALGPGYRRELIHRDNLAILTGPSQ